ncbi:unnamed protein product [Allacma fusca]|uniref:C2H2-type domain-containing protein n=1 Tax=Allacma fusca TaxID=39272 RepID=A0A8J2Q7M7_9HEXA|nr:unnamed protein product [Allacma fusca]
MWRRFLGIVGKKHRLTGREIPRMVTHDSDGITKDEYEDETMEDGNSIVEKNSDSDTASLGSLIIHTTDGNPSDNDDCLSVGDIDDLVHGSSSIEDYENPIAEVLGQPGMLAAEDRSKVEKIKEIRCPTCDKNILLTNLHKHFHVHPPSNYGDAAVLERNLRELIVQTARDVRAVVTAGRGRLRDQESGVAASVKGAKGRQLGTESDELEEVQKIFIRPLREIHRRPDLLGPPPPEVKKMDVAPPEMTTVPVQTPDKDRDRCSVVTSSKLGVAKKSCSKKSKKIYLSESDEPITPTKTSKDINTLTELSANKEEEVEARVVETHDTDSDPEDDVPLVVRLRQDAEARGEIKIMPKPPAKHVKHKRPKNNKPEIELPVKRNRLTTNDNVQDSMLAKERKSKSKNSKQPTILKKSNPNWSKSVEQAAELILSETKKENPNMEELEKAMKTTFQYRKYMYDHNTDIARVLTDFPALQNYSFVKKEFENIGNDLGTLERKLVDPLMLEYQMFAMKHFLSPDPVIAKAKEELKADPGDNDLLRDVQLLCLGFQKTKGKLFGSLYKQRSGSEERFKGVTPTIDIKNNIGSRSCKLTVYCEKMKICEVPNFFDANPFLVRKIANMTTFKLDILPFGQDTLMSQEVVIDGLESDKNICLLCGKIFQVTPDIPISSKVKETIAEIAVVDMGFLVFNEDRLGCCQPCHSKVQSLRDSYTAFLHVRKELTDLSTQISYELKRTNNQLLKGFHYDPLCDDKEDDTFFHEWNLRRIRAMLLSNLQIESEVTTNFLGLEGMGQDEPFGNLELLRPETMVTSFYGRSRSEEPAVGVEVEAGHMSTPSTARKRSARVKAIDRNRGAKKRSKGGFDTRKPKTGDITFSIHDESLDMFKCESCGETFGEYDLFQIHLHANCKASDTDGLRSNSGDMTGTANEFTCNVCSKSFNRGYSLRIHMRTHGADEQLSCDKCDKKFTLNNTLAAHRKIHEKEKQKLKCPICNKMVSQKRAMEAHLHRHHVKDYEVSTVVCDICKKSFDSPLILMSHMEVHGGEYECSVPTCRKTFKSCTLLGNHEKIHNSNATFFDCDFCTVAFKDESAFISHKATHSLSPTFLCDHCGRSFPSKSLLRGHIRLHKNVENRCEICDKSFYSASNLKNHMRLHTGERPFLCVICDQSFVQKVSLNLHMRKHSGVNPFMCPYCKNTGFSYKLALRQHLATKHDEIYLKSKKFLCKICWKNFSTESEQLEHDALHEKHKCKLCNRQFKMLTHLKEHLLRHASLKPHKCIFCEDKSFLRRKGLTDHIKSAHPGKDPEDAANADNITYYVHINND